MTHNVYEALLSLDGAMTVILATSVDVLDAGCGQDSAVVTVVSAEVAAELAGVFRSRGARVRDDHGVFTVYPDSAGVPLRIQVRHEGRRSA